ncbi:MAG: O-antigen ligase family protein, partial [Verrucomicrobiota bacterium]
MALALLMKMVRPVAGVHALLTLAFGLWLCLAKNRPLQIAQWAAYVVGAEVLWRMCKASIPWEFAKQSILLICLVSMVRSQRIRCAWLPALYCALLVPASAFTFVGLSFSEGRQQVSFNLSGPVCLALCVLWFRTLRLTKAGLQRIGVALLGPIAGVAFVALFRMATTEVDFTSGSNAGMSGGYGPNQVSAMLGLGAALAVLLYLGEKGSPLLRAGFAVLALWFLAQSALTLSRTGIYLFGAALGAASVFLIQRKGAAGRLLLVVLLLGVGTCALLPLLDAFTGAKLTERFSDKGLTGRDSVAKLDLRVWRENPVLGAGPGMSSYYRYEVGDVHAAHTEYTRLLAEHGLLGAAALLLLLLMTGQAFLRARGPWAKAIVAALAVWAFLFMAVSAMRLAAPAFLLGLIHARFLADPAAARPVLRREFRSARTVLPRLPWRRRLGR